MGCNKSNEVASPVLFPFDGSKSKVFPQYAPIKGNSQDYQNQTMTAILKQLNQQNELIARMQKQKEKQRIAQEQKLQQMKNQMKLEMMKNKQEEKKKQQLLIDQMKLEKEKIQQEKRRLEKMIDKKPKIDIPDNYKNIGKGVLNKGRNFCSSCINTLPKFIDYQPGLKRCGCQGYGLKLFKKQISLFNGQCEKCTYRSGDIVVELCEECYGYGVVNA